jgi:hypothetical protein
MAPAASASMMSSSLLSLDNSPESFKFVEYLFDRILPVGTATLLQRTKCVQWRDSGRGRDALLTLCKQVVRGQLSKLYAKSKDPDSFRLSAEQEALITSMIEPMGPSELTHMSWLAALGLDGSDVAVLQEMLLSVAAENVGALTASSQLTPSAVALLEVCTVRSQWRRHPSFSCCTRCSLLRNPIQCVCFGCCVCVAVSSRDFPSSHRRPCTYSASIWTCVCHTCAAVTARRKRRRRCGVRAALAPRRRGCRCWEPVIPMRLPLPLPLPPLPLPLPLPPPLPSLSQLTKAASRMPPLRPLHRCCSMSRRSLLPQRRRLDRRGGLPRLAARLLAVSRPSKTCSHTRRCPASFLVREHGCRRRCWCFRCY